ncbi:MAG: OmpH family outer membrane protein [Verrucomicrobiales bacterium]|nr:OmpH family outer membrane protein [Verrucomicrobiales bacterium]
MNRIALLSLLVAGALSQSLAAADMKFGVVDMAKAFSEFYKTKEASSKFKDNVNKAQAEVAEQWAVYKTKMGELQDKQKLSQDPIINQEERAKAAAEGSELFKELRRLEQEIGEFQNRRQGQLKQEDMNIRKGLYSEILEVVKTKAKDEGYDFVFDHSGISLSTVPVVLYYKGAVDFTDEVVVELNKDAPADAAAPSTDEKAKPAEGDKEN